VKIVVEFTLIDQLRVIRIDGFQFDGHLEVSLGVNGLIYLPECALINLADDLEVLADFLQHLRHHTS